MMPLIVIGAVVLVLLVWFISVRNGFIGKRNLADNAFATIDVQLKQRCDLIPNLVSAAQAYMKHERGTLDDLTALRAQAQAAKTPAESIDVNNRIGHALRAFMVNVEAYPDLKASEQFVMLQRSLNEIEAQLAAARRTYNAAVTDFNNAVQMFPSSVVASMSGFATRPLLETSEEDRQRPDVKALFNG